MFEEKKRPQRDPSRSTRVNFSGENLYWIVQICRCCELPLSNRYLLKQIKVVFAIFSNNFFSFLLSITFTDRLWMRETPQWAHKNDIYLLCKKQTTTKKMK